MNINQSIKNFGKKALLVGGLVAVLNGYPETVQYETVQYKSTQILDREHLNSLDLMKELVNYFGRDDLVLTSDQYAHRLRKKKDVEPSSITSGQVLCAGDLPDGKRLVINSYDGLTDKVQSFLDRGGLLYSISDGSPIDIYIYPNANRSLLGIQAQPTEGNVQIIQGEYAITHAKDSNPILSTFGIGKCVGLLLYDPNLKLGSVAHVDYLDGIIPSLRKMIEELDSLGAQKLVFGRTSNIDSMTMEYRIIPEFGIRFSSEIELPRDFSFDTRTGEVKPYQASEDPTFNKRIGEKTDHRIEEHITMCFPVYRPKTKPQ